MKFHFEKFGQILHCVVTSEPTAEFQGHGFIVFKHSRMVRMALAGRPHFIDGVEIELEAVLPTEIFEEKGVEEETPVRDTQVLHEYEIQLYLNLLIFSFFLNK